MTSGTDDGDPSRCGQGDERPRLRRGLPGVGGRDGTRGRSGGHLHLGDALAALPLHVEAGVLEDTGHGDVLAEHLGPEPADAEVATRRGQVLEQEDPHAVAPVVVCHEERDLGRAGIEPLGRRDAHDLVVRPAPRA